MIDQQTKKDFLKELAKTANVSYACNKMGVGRTTYYKWRQDDRDFRKTSDLAIRDGRANITDIAEQALMMRVKDKDLNAIKFVLMHNSPRYKPNKQSRVIMEHHSDADHKCPPAFTMADFTKGVYMKRKEREERDRLALSQDDSD